MTIEEVLKELLGEYFSLVSKFSFDFIKRMSDEKGIRETWY